MTFKEVAAEQKMPLEYKIDTAVAAIGEAFAVSANPGLAFSGGKDSDVWEYIRRFDVPYSPLYDMGYTDSRTGKFVKITRNGCLGCGTDLQFTPNHLSILRQTHPRIWRGLMHCGMGEQIKRLRRFRMGGQLSMLDYAPVEQVIDVNPCAFDQLDNVSFEGMSEFDTAAAFE